MECTRRGRGTIYRPVSNISSRSTHSSADLVRTKSLRATIKYPLEQPVGSDLRSILSGPRFTILSMAKTRPRDRFARLTKISVQMDLPPFLSFFLFLEIFTSFLHHRKYLAIADFWWKKYTKYNYGNKDVGFNFKIFLSCNLFFFISNNCTLIITLNNLKFVKF